jgi:phage-related holin
LAAAFFLAGAFFFAAAFFFGAAFFFIGVTLLSFLLLYWLLVDWSGGLVTSGRDSARP